MTKKLSALCALLFGSTSVAAPAPRSPTAAWVVDFADSQCIASRNYGSADNPLLLVMKAPALGDVLQIGIVRKGAVETPTQMNGEIIFDERPPSRASLLEFGMKQANHMVLLANLPRDGLAPMRSASSIRIRARDADEQFVGRATRITRPSAKPADYSFRLTQVPALLDTLDKCAADLRRVWNVEEANPPTLVRENPSGDLRKVFSSDDYPWVALIKEQGGSIKVAILVDEKGRVADCTVIQTSGVASLDVQSCVLIQQRAQLRPATGLDGKPTKGALIQKITWRVVE